MDGIFVSYRRSDHPEIVHTVCTSLIKRYSGSRVFLDVDRIVGGAPFFNRIKVAINSSRVVLVFIGPCWATITDDQSEGLRLFNPTDFVRQEIEQALRTSVTIIPIRIAGASVPNPTDLPDSLLKILDLHILELRPDFFEHDLRRLTRHLDLYFRVPSGRALFSRNNLSGWYLAGPHATEVSLSDGILSAWNRSVQAGYVDHLVTRETNFSNFFLTCEFMLMSDQAPAAIEIRVDPSNVTFGGMRGYLIAAGGTDYFAQSAHPEIQELADHRLTTLSLSSRVRPGFRLGETAHEPLELESWHKLEIQAKSRGLSVWLNRHLDLTVPPGRMREPSIFVEDQGSAFSTGAIALVFYPQASLRFRNFKVTTLRTRDHPSTKLRRWLHRQMIKNEWNERWQVFQQISATNWVESITDSSGFQQNFFSETARTGKFIELQREFGMNKRVVVRLFESYALIGSAREYLFEKRDGQWIDDSTE